MYKLEGVRVIEEGAKLIGTREIIGSKHNPVIIDWAKDLGLEKIYTNDEIPWCGLFVAYVVKQATFEPVKDPLWARNWNLFGTKQSVAMLGDILVFSRGTGGHVGLYVGEDNTCYHVLGGNQGDMVCITRILKSRCIGIRRCPWKIAQPVAVKRYYYNSKNQQISSNEA